MTEQISKAAAERLKAEFYKHRERFEDGYKEWCAVIDSMTEPDHEWKVDEWAMVDEDTIIRVKQIGTDWIQGAHQNVYDKSLCVPVDFIQTAKSKIGKGNIVRTPKGWIGSVISFDEERHRWFIRGVDDYGWYFAAELTLCSPEVK